MSWRESVRCAAVRTYIYWVLLDTALLLYAKFLCVYTVRPLESGVWMPQLICGEGLWYFMWSVWPSMMVEVDAEMGLIESGERVGSESSLQGRDTNRQ